MNRVGQIISYIVIIAFPGFLAAQSTGDRKLKDEVISDYKNFYSPNNLWKLALGIGYAGFYANTAFDREIQEFYGNYLKSNTTDDISKVVKPFGNGRIMFPIYFTAALIGELSEQSKPGSTIGEWGQRCSRSILVGAPTALFLQLAIGSSRPEDGTGSRWRPFKDNNGVSGHSFMGAVPFLTAAKMTDNRFLKCSLYLGSMLTGFSRINDDKHYFSQSILGWWIALLAVNSVDMNKTVVVPSATGIGFMVCF